MGDIIGCDVPPDMVDGHQGHVQGKGGGFGEVHPHQHRPDEPRRVGDGHRVNVPPGDARLDQGLVREARDGLNVLAGGNLRHHAAIDGVHVRLGGDGVGQNRPPVSHHRHGGFVTGGLHS